MNGNEIYDDKIEKRILATIEKSSNREILNGFNNYIGSSRALSTKEIYIHNIDRFLNYINKPVEQIKFDDYSSFLSQFKDNTQSNQIVVYSSIKNFSNYLYISKRADRDIMQGLNRPKAFDTPKTIQKRENGYLNQKELRRYLYNIDKAYNDSDCSNWVVRDKCIILLFLSTGLRCSAVSKLDIDSIDFFNGTLITMEKGNKIRRDIMLPDELLELLEEWIYLRKDIIKDENEKALFVGKRLNRLTREGLSQIVKKYAIGIDGKEISPHKLRATYGIQIYQKTKDIYATQISMGHSSPSITEIYIRGEKEKIAEQSKDIMSKILF